MVENKRSASGGDTMTLSPPFALGLKSAAHALRPLAAVSVAALLSACASFSPNGGVARREFGQESVAIQTPEDAASARRRVTHLLKRPLSANAAVEIALRSNRGLQAAYNRLGIAEAIMVRDSLPPNPSISLSGNIGSLSSEIEGAIAADILALATLPARADIAANRFEVAQLEAAEATLRVATEARRAYYRAVAARERVQVLEQAAAVAETAAKLAHQLGETGAMPKLDQARDQLFYAEIATRLVGARQKATGERERLIRALGLWGGDLSFALPNALPAPPARVREMPMVEREAVERRIDLRIARKELDALAKSLGLTEDTRLIDLFQISGLGKITRENVSGEKVTFNNAGGGATIEIPIFDLGETRVRESEQHWLEAVNLLAEKAVNVRSEAREAYRAYRSTYEIARRHQREIMPLHAIIGDETLRRYNTMIVDVFALLEDARRRVLATGAAIEAKQDFWLAEVDLRAAIAGGGMARATEDKPASLSIAETGTQRP
jgi:outer membrane protein TolC